ncbi:monovalent cation/H(+) antiporter subunit G [Coprothermobacter platensis]|uniref:monovalent cation/H(+) antiporter subunit G n=1 Tax=Coprothermobacter platensis TaxID=108819 RepID=UPI00037FB761|nr:monovalent cation/H(+) antiporter subunit G [Coprothermobacter platensis]
MDYVAYVLYGIGIFFNFAGVVGIFRMPDPYCKLQTSTKNVTLGCISIMCGLFIREINLGLIASFGVKPLLLALFMLITNPTASHVLAQACYYAGVPMWSKSVTDHLKGKKEAGSDER